jgi:hypothetical protein
MAYGLSTRAFADSEPADDAAKADSIRSAARSWHTLSETCRLAIVEEAVRAANDHFDTYPLAL